LIMDNEELGIESLRDGSGAPAINQEAGRPQGKEGEGGGFGDEQGDGAEVSHTRLELVAMVVNWVEGGAFQLKSWKVWPMRDPGSAVGASSRSRVPERKGMTAASKLSGEPQAKSSWNCRVESGSKVAPVLAVMAWG
jgi:hypothetical protein